jgi:fused-like protein
MEYCESDLMKYFKKETLFKTEDLLNIFKQIVKAFIFMSVNGVIHRDLKPENCLLSKGTIVKIGDFGCAKAVG